MANNIVDVILKLTNQFSPASKEAEGSASSLIDQMGKLNQAVELVGKVGSAAMSAFNATIKEGVALNSKFANTQIQIAGTLKAFDVVKSFDAGKDAAASLYGMMEDLAAPLPGSVDDYVNVFQRSLPSAIKAFQTQGGASMKDIAQFTSKFAAVAIANNVDAAQAAADIPRLLGGQAGMDVITYGKLRGLIEKSAKDIGVAAENAEQFNKLKPEQRLAIMQKVIEGSKDTIDAYGNTLDAQQGTLDSVRDKFLRTFSANVYTGAVSGLTAVNNWLGKNSAAVEGLATLLGSKLGGAIEGITSMATNFANTVGAGMLGKLLGASGSLGAGMADLGTGALAAYSAPLAIITSTFSALAQNTQFVDALFSGLGSLLQLVVPLFAYVGQAVQMVGELLAAVLAPLLLAVVGAANTVATYLAPIFGFLVEFLSTWIERIKPIFVAVAEGIATLVTGIVDFLMPVFTILVAIVTNVADTLGQWLMPYLTAFGNALSALFKGIGEFLSWLGKSLGKELGIDLSGGLKAAQEAGKTTATGGFADMLANLSKNLKANTSTMDASTLKLPDAAKGVKTKTPNQRSSVHNDFRGSKFDITQKFAEGFDPDRIAAAFTDDLSKLANARLDSSLAPAFSAM